MNPKCPHCKSVIASLSISPVPGYALPNEKYLCVVLTCQTCNTAIGAQIDPIAIKTDIKNAIRDRN